MINQDQIIQKISQIIYSFIGSSKATRLAQTTFGKSLYRFLNKQNNSLKIYSGMHGLKLKLSSKEAYSLGFYYLGVINPFETKIIEKILEPGDVFIDVGAYIDGWHSLIASRIVGDTGHVYTFEPIYFKRLKENIDLNKLKNITINTHVVSDKNGKSIFYDFEEKSSIIKRNINGLKKKYTLKATTLDHYILVNRISHVRMLKVDVEGAEMKVLKGAEKLLKIKHAPELIVEVINEHLQEGGVKEKEVIVFLTTLGYKPAIFTSKGLIKYNAKLRRRGNNLFFSKNLSSFL